MKKKKKVSKVDKKKILKKKNVKKKTKVVKKKTLVKTNAIECFPAQEHSQNPKHELTR